ncbi:PP2C family protein-serine/threonine phosphatase [Psychromicrobium lacuslunae]|uniref:PP2C family protein-serine/threonine phosphatase n=1 Tax=Psychromicrobium lacuslunae TaxID=1618207 RepID=UPI0009E44A61|nr:protein phosphatase 2C domain-containing protein [Psychromicrobium lacuslunae]
MNDSAKHHLLDDADTIKNLEPESPAQGVQEHSVQHQITVRSGSQTDRGLRRELNEDSFLAVDPIFAVADGMGGHEAGEVASRECINTLIETPELAAGRRDAGAADVQAALLKADSRIRELTNARAGTTATGVVLVEEAGNPYWLVFNVGDSRTYRLSKGTFEQVSVDHSEVQELVDAGQITSAEALVHPRRHVVTRALGTGDDIEADYWLIPVEDGDRYLVCSDGLTAELSDEQIFRTLSTLGQPQEAADSLVQAALRSGGRDNVTVIVVDATDVLQEADLLTTAPRPETETDTLPRGLPTIEPVAEPATPSGLTGTEAAANEFVFNEPAPEPLEEADTAESEVESSSLDLITDLLDESEQTENGAEGGEEKGEH